MATSLSFPLASKKIAKLQLFVTQPNRLNRVWAACLSPSFTIRNTSVSFSYSNCEDLFIHCANWPAEDTHRHHPIWGSVESFHCLIQPYYRSGKSMNVWQFDPSYGVNQDRGQPSHLNMSNNVCL